MSLALDLPADDPSIAALGPDARARVARVWTERSAAEQRAAVLFTLVARDLLADGAIPEVLDLATRAVHDELRHVEVCRQVATRYAGTEVPWPAPEPAPEPGFRDAPPDLTRVLHVVFNTCIAESVGAAFLQVCRADAEGPLVRAALQVLLRDDVGHARIGWAHLASGRVAARHLPAIGAALPGLLRAVRDGWYERCAEIDAREAPPPGHGCATTSAIRGAVDMTLREVIVPGFEYLGLDTTAARRWLASVPA
jgi:hypothetical protein